MTTVLVLTAIPVVLAAGLDSTGFGLVAGAGFLWTAALYACSKAPVIAGRHVTFNESAGAFLSLLATVLAIAGVLMVFLHTL